MIDPLVSLAFGVYSNKGVYAILAGSGVSRSSRVPTGWEVVLDLTRKLAVSIGTNCDADPAAWYRTTFGEEPDYSKLLDRLAPTAAERSQLLRGYFEPSQEEREQGVKVPSRSHNAVAQLVSEGYVRVVLTTNFDRLLESAIEARGITPVVISTPDACEGALPIQHNSCTVVKLNGDYLDTRIKNTPEELAIYDERLRCLLDRILDEYGLIVCGWSADWDSALRNAMERCKNHRFSTFWAEKEGLSDAAKRLCALRRAIPVHITTADKFFGTLVEKVSALAEYSKPHPLSATMAVAALKKYLVEPKYRIALHDLVRSETERAYASYETRLSDVRNQPTKEEIESRATYVLAATEIVRALIRHGCYWGDAEQTDLWSATLERLATQSTITGVTYTYWAQFRYLPAALCLYSGGIAALAAGRYHNLAALMLKSAMLEDQSQKKQKIISVAVPALALGDGAKSLPGLDCRKTPASDYFFERLRDEFRDLIPDDRAYRRLFELFEYLVALTYADMRETEGGMFWGPVGRFGWSEVASTWITDFEAEAARSGSEWPLFRAGFFNSKYERFKEIADAYRKEILSHIPFDWRI